MSVDRAMTQILVRMESTGPQVVARSIGTPFSWEEAALQAAVRYGQPPNNGQFPDAVFAVPMGSSHVSIGQVTHSPFAIRFLILHRKLYETLGGDPFLISDRFPPDWSQQGTLDALEWPLEMPPARRVESAQTILKAGDTALLLGGVQAILDGSRILIPSSEPKSATIVRDLWSLLPERSRWELWPATFAFSAELGFHVAVVPELPNPMPMGYLTSEQTRDYPEGRYELALQIAIEAGNQGEFERLLARRSSAETLRLAMTMLLMAIVIAVFTKFIG